jgi:hypothetical protein
VLLYVSTERFSQTLAPLTIYYRPDLLRFLRFVPYEHLDVLKELGKGVVIWTDFDRLDRKALEKAGKIHSILAARGVLQLNSPSESLGRFDLLRRLAETGINDFNVYRLDEASRVKQFPAFLRNESGIARKRPELHNSADELIRAVARFRPEKDGPGEPMIVEFVDARDDDGLFRKYGAFRAGGRIYPQHIFFGTDWFVKNPWPTGDQYQMSRHLDYFQSDLHTEELLRIFELARIEYGRVDYCVHRGRVQVFEINTNPTIINDAPTVFDLVDSRPYADRHAEALLALPGAADGDDSGSAGGAILAVHERVMRGLRWKFKRRRVKLTVRRGVRRLLAGTYLKRRQQA